MRGNGTGEHVEPCSAVCGTGKVCLSQRYNGVGHWHRRNGHVCGWMDVAA